MDNECPWCNEDIEHDFLFDKYNSQAVLDEEWNIKFECPHCGNWVSAEITLAFHLLKL
jgi:transcription elongation factor Elf1